MELSLQGINLARSGFFEDTYKSKQAPTVLGLTASWVGHKVMTVISLSANLAAIGAGAIGAVATACTLGAFKVAVFALTLGNVRPSFPIGFIWCSELAFTGLWNSIVNGGEFLYEAGNGLYQASRVIQWVGEQLHLGGFIQAIFHEIGRFFSFLAERLEKGFTKALEVENYQPLQTSPFKDFDHSIEETRLDLSASERHFDKIAAHTALSVVSIPLNGTTSICAGATSVILGVAFIGKTVLYASTNINIPIPTYAGQAFRVAWLTGSSAAKDIGTDVADLFITMYKVSDCIGLIKVAAAAIEVALYIPRAIFT